MDLAVLLVRWQVHILASLLASVAVIAFVGDSRFALSGEARASTQVDGGAPGNQVTPALAFDGTKYLVAWHDRRSGNDIYGARVSLAGAVLDPGGIPISAAPNPKGGPALAFDGTNYLVAWEDGRLGPVHIYAARVSSAGAVLDSGGIAISSEPQYQAHPSLAFDGTNYLIAGLDLRSAQTIYGARVSPAGAVLDPGGIAISTALSSHEQPALAFDGTNYLVAWHDRRAGDDIYGARVSSAGAVLDPGGIAISTAPDDQAQPALAFDGTNYLVTWTDWRSDLTDIYGARVSPAGAVLDPGGIPVGTTPTYQISPALAFDGTNYLVVWEDDRSGTDGDIYGARISPAGAVLDPGGILIANTLAYQVSPSLAFDGTNYLVVWEDNRSGTDRDIYAARVSPAGTVLDPGGILISTAGPPAPPPPVPPPVRCVVPRVIGLRLAQARTRIRRSKCSVGLIRRAHSRRVGRVIAQSPRPGARRAHGASVNLVVGRR